VSLFPGISCASSLIQLKEVVSFMRLLCQAAVLAAGALVAPSAVARFQEPAPAPSPESAPAPQQAEKKHRKQVHENEFLVKGTVFTPQGLSFPGAELRIRRAGEKKFRWQALTDRRGEFAVWIPMGTDYEVRVMARGYAEQTRAVDGKTGGRQEDLVFRMQPASGGKTK
jgi:hypothetical protein